MSNRQKWAHYKDKLLIVKCPFWNSSYVNRNFHRLNFRPTTKSAMAKIVLWPDDALLPLPGVEVEGIDLDTG